MLRRYVCRPRRSCGKVMFSHMSVILFTGGCVCPSACWHTHTPRQTPQADTPPVQTPRADPLQINTALGDTPWADTSKANNPLPSACWDTHPPCPVHVGIDMATAADGTHPTGMHSCFDIFFLQTFWSKAAQNHIKHMSW